jgi:CubicO group peptidase (beta-lactamase class C family)
LAIEIHGFCDPAFQPMADAFRMNFEDGLEVGASLGMTHRGKPVVDLWAGHFDREKTRPWEKDTIVLLNSTSKIPLVYSFLMVVDRGLVDLDARVADYWPEFAAGGKDRVTVREAITYRAGVPSFDPPIPGELLRDWPALTARLAAETHWFGGDSRICYHPVTIGIILGEIMRRVDGRLPAQFFREEIAEKAGIDFQMHLRDPADLERVSPHRTAAPPRPFPPSKMMAQRLLGGILPSNPTRWERLSYDLPAGSGCSNGRAIARLCSIGAMGGELDGVRYLSKEIIDEASSLQAEGEDPLFGPIRWGLGFALDGKGYPGPTPTCFHWGGAGGSFALMDQPTGVSCGYAMNNLIFGEDHPRNEARNNRLWNTLGEVMRSL